MVRAAPGTSALLMAASTLGLIDAGLQYKVRVTNLTHQQPFSPVVILAHNERMYGFRVGLEANFALKILAETGDLSSLVGLAERADIAPCLCGVAFGSDMVPPGETVTLSMVVTGDNCPDGPLFTMASMLVNTNDGFVGIDSATLSTSGASTIYPPAYDAGTNEYAGFSSTGGVPCSGPDIVSATLILLITFTIYEWVTCGRICRDEVVVGQYYHRSWGKTRLGTEENNELCTHIPGPACSASSGNKEAGPGEGYVHVHPGISDTGGDLSAADYGWTNPVAEVFIEAPTPV